MYIVKYFYEFDIFIPYIDMYVIKLLLQNPMLCTYHEFHDQTGHTLSKSHSYLNYISEGSVSHINGV